MEAAPYWWAVPLVGSASLIAAFYAVFSNRRTARLKATLDLIERVESSEHYQKLFRSFRMMRKNHAPDLIPRLMDPQNDTDLALRRDIIAYLNHYELVAIGCSLDILDERFYSRWMRSDLLADWATAQEFVTAARAAQVRPVRLAYAEFQAMAERLGAPKPTARPPWYRRAAAAGLARRTPRR